MSGREVRIVRGRLLSQSSAWLVLVYQIKDSFAFPHQFPSYVGVGFSKVGNPIRTWVFGSPIISDTDSSTVSVLDVGSSNRMELLQTDG